VTGTDRGGGGLGVYERQRGNRTASLVLGLAMVMTAGAIPALAQGQTEEYPLFDSFSFAFEAAWAGLDTNIRLDSKEFGVGTEIDFESDGGLAESETVPSLSLEWRIGRRHHLNGWWQSVDRDASRQILTEIRFGDVVFPIEEVVTFGFDEEEFGVGYRYYPILKRRTAFGVGGGLRTLRVGAGLRAQEIDLSEEGDFTGPLPFLSLEVRYAIARKLRLVSDLGILYIEIGEYSGGQVILDTYLEHLTFRNVAFGLGVRGGRVSVEVDTEDFAGKAKIAVASARIYARVRF